MINFLKGIIVGIGGIAPGLSGSVFLVILGLYQKTISAIGTLFKDFKKNVIFLLPLILGFGVGIILFSKVVDFLLANYEMYTRFAFLGLVLGTIPLFYKEVKKEGFNKKYYILVAISFAIGLGVFFFNKDLFPTITNPNIFQSVILGVAVAGSSIVPGVDSAVILSSLGLYELYVGSIADFNLSVLIPAGFGLVFGALIISFIMNKLIKRYYTITFSIIFGLFLSIIPNVLNGSCVIGLNLNTLISFIILLISFAISYYLGNVKENTEKLKQFAKRISKFFKKLTKSYDNENNTTE
jgi:putative membrane protein